MCPFSFDEWCLWSYLAHGCLCYRTICSSALMFVIAALSCSITLNASSLCQALRETEIIAKSFAKKLIALQVCSWFHPDASSLDMILYKLWVLFCVSSLSVTICPEHTKPRIVRDVKYICTKRTVYLWCLYHSYHKNVNIGKIISKINNIYALTNITTMNTSITKNFVIMNLRQNECQPFNHCSIATHAFNHKD